MKGKISNRNIRKTRDRKVAGQKISVNKLYQTVADTESKNSQRVADTESKNLKKGKVTNNLSRALKQQAQSSRVQAVPI